MAVTAFLSFGSSARGESVQKGHEGWIELRSWSWTVDAQSSWMKGGGATVGRPTPGSLTWTHTFDTASIELFRAIWVGNTVPAAELHVVRSIGAPFLVVKLTDVLITEIASSQASSDAVEQSVAMVFREISIEYRQLEARGAVRGTQSITWDIPAGTVSPSAVAAGAGTPAAGTTVPVTPAGAPDFSATPFVPGLADRPRPIPGQGPAPL